MYTYTHLAIDGNSVQIVFILYIEVLNKIALVVGNSIKTIYTPRLTKCLMGIS